MDKNTEQVKSTREMSCMERAKRDAEARKKTMGTTNRELMKEIIELKKMVKDLSYQLASHA